MRITVRACFADGGPAFGFEPGGRRRNGDVFTVDESIFDPSWMEIVEETEPEEDTTADAGKKTTTKAGGKAGK